MFTTHEPFRFPIQFDDGSTIWRCVELGLNSPWLIVTVDSEDEIPRTFLLHGTDDLLQVAQAESLGKLRGVRLVLPPHASPTCDWTFVPVCKVERELRSVDGAAPSAVVTSRDGRRYGGFPIGPTERRDEDLAVLVNLGNDPT